MIKKNKLSPLVKWPGGKEQELKYIIPALPLKFCNYYEPFLGGGAGYFTLSADHYFVNDKSEELIGLYKILVSEDREYFFTILDDFVLNWSTLGDIVTSDKKGFFLNLYHSYSMGNIDSRMLSREIESFIKELESQFLEMFEKSYNFDTRNFLLEIKKSFLSKIIRMTAIELKKGKLSEIDIIKNLETALKGAFYMNIRSLYNKKTLFRMNKGQILASFFFLRSYAYSGMFRYNKNGEFNVPYGGIGYNEKGFDKKVEYLKSPALRSHISNSSIENSDFETFFEKFNPNKEDFIFLDPPYDTSFSTYDKNVFDQNDQIRLADYLINNCVAKWMMIVKNTEFIFSLYNNQGLNIKAFEKKYLVSFMNRNNKDVEHLLITNY